MRQSMKGLTAITIFIVVSTNCGYSAERKDVGYFSAWQSPLAKGHYLYYPMQTSNEENFVIYPGSSEVQFPIKTNGDKKQRFKRETGKDDISSPWKPVREKENKRVSLPSVTTERSNMTNSANEEESLPTPEPLIWRKYNTAKKVKVSDSPYDSRVSDYSKNSQPRRRVYPSRVSTSFSSDNSGAERKIEGYVYTMPPVEYVYEDKIAHDSSDSVSRPYRIKNYDRRKIRRFPPGEDEYSLYSSGRRPYAIIQRAHSRTPTSQKPSVPLLSSLINTGSGILKMLNPLNYFLQTEPKSSPPPSPYQVISPSRPAVRNVYYRRPPTVVSYDNEDDRDPLGKYELDHSANYRDYPSRYQQSNQDNEAYEYRNYDSDDYMYGNYDNIAYERNKPGNHDNEVYADYSYRDRHQNAMSRYKNEEFDPLRDFTHDFEDSYSSKFDDGFAHEGYNNFKGKTSTRPRLPAATNPRKMKEGERNFPNMKKIKGSEYVDDPRTIEFLQENPLRNDIYIGKDGNLYLRDSNTDSNDFYGLDMYGMDHPETAQESKTYDLVTSGQRKVPAYMKPSQDRAKGKKIESITFPSGNTRTDSQPKGVRDLKGIGDRVGRIHSNFALKKFSTGSNS